MQGIKDEWKALPRRHCDNCAKRYQPKQPLRRNQRHGFCCETCKKDFHRHGGSYAKLKPVIVEEVRRRIRELAPMDAGRLEAIERRLTRIENAMDALAGTLLTHWVRARPKEAQ